jgi:hypothetical protein
MGDDDNSGSYYMTFEQVASLDDCKGLCLNVTVCTGIEFASGYCEVWTRNIEDSMEVTGHTCLRYEPIDDDAGLSPGFDHGTFELVDGGTGKACRGANTKDNSASYFTLHDGTASLDDCKALCRVSSACTGIEFANSLQRCEVWTHPIGATISYPPAKCLEYTPPQSAAWELQPVDGGVGRVCRGDDESDNLASHYTMHQDIASFDKCKALCQADSTCTGIEFLQKNYRCEVWKHPISASAVYPGATCLKVARPSSAPAKPSGPAEPQETTTLAPPARELQAVEGGSGRACRGNSPSDNSESYFTVHDETASLDDCKALCHANTACTGIEYAGSMKRCEVWTHPIEATSPYGPAMCMRYDVPDPADFFEPVNGGDGQGCRGSSPSDNLDRYFELSVGVGSLDDCKALCMSKVDCAGIEFGTADGGRCEVWTYPIGASTAIEGLKCLRYIRQVPATALVQQRSQKKEKEKARVGSFLRGRRRWEAFGGEWPQPRLEAVTGGSNDYPTVHVHMLA